MSAKKTELIENEEPTVINNYNTTINIVVNDGGSVTVMSEPKENPPKPPGPGG